MRLPVTAAIGAALLMTAACAPGASSGASPSAPAPSDTAPSASAPAWPVVPDDAPVALFLGDSYTAGTALPVSDLHQRWSTLIAGERGWRELNAGCNGSGFVRVGPVCEYNYPERVSALAAATDVEPAVVIMLGGINDRGSDEAEVRANIRLTVERLRAEFPDATLFAATAFTYSEPAHPRLAQVNEELRLLADEYDFAIIELGEPIADDPALLAPDGLHPSVAGHAAIAAAISAGLGDYSPG